MGGTYFTPSRVEDGDKPFLLNIDGDRETDKVTNHVHSLLIAQISGPAFPCGLGKAAIAKLRYRLGVYDTMTASAAQLCQDLWKFVEEQPRIGETIEDYSTFIAIFKDEYIANELSYEKLLWDLLQGVHELDAGKNEWDPATSADPDDPNFSFSVASKSFFLVGMHPNSSRRSRRFGYAAIAFNSHHQFQHLREVNRFEKMQDVIRRQDIQIQGDINPNLTDFGQASEALQYSGRKMQQDWRCPFRSSKLKPKLLKR